ncbi:MAG: hypothetical protein AMJ65_15515 [Phycisphaerae bacterium SG8_4]|nr:MAG: hypothetical protein AMJ65_15515 [Phycisphaerae bacterium SG8_4]
MSKFPMPERQVYERPGMKIVLFPSGTIHAWIVGEEATYCGRKLGSDVELLLNDGSQSFTKTCEACQLRYNRESGK